MGASERRLFQSAARVTRTGSVFYISNVFAL